MDIEAVPKQIVQRLCIEFQETEDDVLFQRILIRVDRLVVSIIKKLQRRLYHLQLVDIQDLYQTAIVGLYNGVLKVKEEETADHTVARLIAYMRAEVKKTYPYHRPIQDFERIYQQSVPVYQDLEFEYLNDIFENLIREGIISRQDFDLLYHKEVDKYTYRALAAVSELHVNTVRARIDAVKNRLRHQLRLRGVVGE
jgi:DNA-directed RNA polymerase specialized sigma24 family protein